MLQPGLYHKLKVKELTPGGLLLDDGADGLLLPARFASKKAKVGDEIDVFIYQDGEGNYIPSTQHPKGTLGDIVNLKVVSTNKSGAFLDWGLPKDLFIHRSELKRFVEEGEQVLVRIYFDEGTGRLAATERFDEDLGNEHLTVKEMEEVDLVVLRKSDIGYVVMVNEKHLGLLHYNEVFIDLFPGEKLRGFVKAIREENKMDIVLGRAGYAKVEDEAGKILALLEKANGYLPYHDKSDPEDIYRFFGMSKKTFKMTIGNLYRQKLISIGNDGITLLKK